MCLCDLGLLCFQVTPMCLMHREYRCDVMEFGSCCRLSRCLSVYLCIKIHRVRSTARSGARQQPTATQTLCCPLVSDHMQPLISFHIPTENNKLSERLYCLSTYGDTVLRSHGESLPPLNPFATGLDVFAMSTLLSEPIDCKLCKKLGCAESEINRC